MRGERDPSIVNGIYRGNAPSTPSTASTNVRQNPMIYQRTHSNESDKDTSRCSDWLENPSTTAQAKPQSKFHKSSSPGRQWLMGSPGRTVGSNRTIPQHSTHRGLGFTGRSSPSGVRRSSAAGLTHRPPLPPNIGNRSQSLDGLLDAGGNDEMKTVAGGVSETTLSTLTPPNESADPHDSPLQTNNRRSRSMEDLLDERDETELIDDNDSDCTRSMEHLADDTVLTVVINPESSDNLKDIVSIGSTSSLNRNRTPSEQPCGSETITIENAVRATSPALDEDTRSTGTAYSRQDSINSKDSNGDKKKTFLNRYVKKVRSLIKK